MHFGVCWPFTPDTRWLIVAPLFHAAWSIAVLVTVWNAGHQVVLPAFDAGQALDLIEQHAITATLVVPTMLAVLSDEQLARPRGEVGELVGRGPNVMIGYWNKPAETAAALVGGWYRTGDLGYQDDEGFVFLVDRAKDMIVTGGENVYSTEVEDALYRHPAVLEAAVFGIPDTRWGEAVHAVVVTRAPVRTDELIAHCRSLIAGYKVPRAIEMRSEPLPKSGAGKL